MTAPHNIDALVLATSSVLDVQIGVQRVSTKFKTGSPHGICPQLTIQQGQQRAMDHFLCTVYGICVTGHYDSVNFGVVDYCSSQLT